MDTFGKAPHPDWPPRIQGFDPVRCLGIGSQGQVWLMDPHDGSAAVAAKFLTPSAGQERAAAGGFANRHNESQITQEWRLLAQFRHEHLIPVHRLVADADGGLVLLMEFAAGGSLGAVVRAKGPLSVGEAVTVLTPIGQVLAFLHGRGAVHGDVSAGNILLSAGGKPFLADFGFSRVLGQAPGEPAGTPGFHCPSDEERDEASDVFSLAAVGWFALTGRIPPPTRDRPPLATLVPDVPRELVAALEAGLQEDPEQRPTAAALAQAVFRSAKAEAVILANAVHPSVLPELPTRRAVKSQRKVRRVPARGWGPLRGSRLRARNRRDARGAGRLPALRWFHGRKVKGLAVLWGSAELPRRKAKEQGPPPEPANHRGGRRAAGGAAVWSMGVLGLVACVLGVAVAAGGWPGRSGVGGAVTPPALDGDPPAALPWAVPLPSGIRAGLAASEPQEALPALAWTRSFALSTRDRELLGHINDAGSPALAADLAIVDALDAAGHEFSGLEFTVEQVAGSPASYLAGSTGHGGEDASSGSATLQATIVTGPFAEQDAAGAVVHNHPREQRQELQIVLKWDGGRWLLQQVLAEAQAAQ